MFAPTLLLLLGVGWAALSTGEQLATTLREVTQLQEATKRLSVLLARTIDLETGQRGYLLTGDAQYLRPYQMAESEVSADFRAVDEALREYPEAREELAAIEDALANEARRDRDLARGLSRTGQQSRNDADALGLRQSHDGRHPPFDRQADRWMRAASSRTRQAHLEHAIAQRNVSIFSSLGLAIVASVAGVAAAGGICRRYVRSAACAPQPRARIRPAARRPPSWPT